MQSETFPVDDPRAVEFWRKRKERDAYWSAIQEMRREYIQDQKGVYDLSVRPRIDYWANEKYGFQMQHDGEGNYTAEYTITDPKKFMLFQIKYWK